MAGEAGKGGGAARHGTVAASPARHGGGEPGEVAAKPGKVAARPGKAAPRPGKAALLIRHASTSG